MGFFKRFSVHFLSVLASTPLSGRLTHHEHNFSDIGNDVMLRRSVKGYSVLAILRGLYIGSATRHLSFSFLLLLSEGATLFGRPESGFIRHPHQFKAN